MFMQSAIFIQRKLSRQFRWHSYNEWESQINELIRRVLVVTLYSYKTETARGLKF